MNFTDYISICLEKCDRTSYTDEENVTHSIVTCDGMARLSHHHTLVDYGARVFSNRALDLKTSISDGMVNFYANSLAAGDPTTADTLICRRGLDGFVTIPKNLQILTFAFDGWFLFSRNRGFITDRWWDIYGYLPK